MRGPRARLPAGAVAAGDTGPRHGGAAALTLGALGVVFGDIGTSPLYALQTVFHADHGAVPPPTRGLRRALARVLVDHDHRLAQVRDVHHARGQRRARAGSWP
jgi:hypothetical protein